MEDDRNETVVVRMERAARMRLDSQICRRMTAKGIELNDFKALDLGFDLPKNWPLDMNCEVTLAQLTVVALALDMRIEITNLDMLKRKKV